MPNVPAPDHVILLHGLCRSSRSMAPMEKALIRAGFSTDNVSYPSRSHAIERLSEDAIGQALERGTGHADGRIHFVTHSLGGILVRSYLDRHSLPRLGQVVMLAPPNQGSEVVDRIGAWALFGWLNGPAGRELGTAASSTPNRLGRANFPVGVIAGNRSWNLINSLLIPGPNDGKVSVERTRLAGMADHLVMAATHTFLMRHPTVIRQTIAFLRRGRFDRSEPV